MALPSGLGAGGRGKEKAPCRYLHFEVDWDVHDGNTYHDHEQRNGDAKKKVHKLGIGLGPTGKLRQPVCSSHVVGRACLIVLPSYRRSGLIVTFDGSITRY